MDKEKVNAAAIITQDGRTISVNLPKAFFASQSFGVTFDREDIVTGEPDDHEYFFFVILYAIGDNVDIIAQYRDEERLNEVFREMKTAIMDGQVYQMPPVEE